MSAVYTMYHLKEHVTKKTWTFGMLGYTEDHRDEAIKRANELTARPYRLLAYQRRCGGLPYEPLNELIKDYKDHWVRRLIFG